MPDPFDVLRTPVEPIEPDPNFTARLRSRIERALALPEGTDMPRIVLDPEPLSEPMAPNEVSAYPGVVPYLAVADARRALAWYVDVLGARPRGEPIVMPDGRIGHAEIDVGGGVLLLSDQHPEIGVVAPVPGLGASVSLHLEVVDVDAAADRAVAAGARLDRAPADNPYGRNAVVVDPFGHRWMLTAPVLPASGTSGPGHGDVSYASLWTPDVMAAAKFYGAVLGWRYAPGSESQGRRVEGVDPPLGLWGGQDRSTTFLCFAVDDIDAALERVRVAGGRAGEARREPYGLVADCADDQGMAFALSEAAGSGVGGTGGGQPAEPVHGELAYLVLGMPDTARARAFFASVLGWQFTPGRVDDGWNVEGMRPMAGMHGGADTPVVVPIFAVDDVHAAVARVRAAGGTSTDPEQMPYGVTADCTDDQGARFYLGQLG